MTQLGIYAHTKDLTLQKKAGSLGAAHCMSVLTSCVGVYMQYQEFS